jgi:galactose oxidase-like protein
VLSAGEIQADMKVSDSTASQFGQWASPVTWPLVAVNMTLLPTGRVLVWDGQNFGTDARVWDPSTGTLTPVPSQDNLFCSGQSLLSDGRTLVAGGHVTGHLGIVDTNIFNHSTQTWSSAPPMDFPRWYPTTTTLPDGRVLVTAGEIGCNAMPPDGSFHPECVADIPEVYNPSANSWTQLSGASLAIPYYPHMFVLPDGKVLNTSTAEGPVPARVLDVANQTWTVADPTAVDGGSAAMFEPGKVIKSGTSTNPDNPGVATRANTYVLDATQPSPAWRQVQPMAYPRAYHYLTLLPDGNVLATGGSRTTDVFNMGAAVLQAEVWSPVTEQWTTLASMVTPRVYHSTALLLPDGRVLTAGGGRFGVDQFSAEIFSPPYLFKGPRPTITSAPATLQYGASFSVGTPDGGRIATVSLIRLGAVTHAFNFDQRFLQLSFGRGDGGLTVQAPGNANLAPPGYYMLFIVDSNGVPSVAAMVRFP